MSERLVWQRDREIENEKTSAVASTTSTEKVDKSSVGFLYKKDELDKEAYLTGKRVDKNFTAYLEIEKNNFDSSLNPHKSKQDCEFDLGRKCREDPLAIVKEKERERFKKLQANPQKMARMKKLMMAYIGNNSDTGSSDDESTKSDRDTKSHSRKRRNCEDKKRARDRKRSRSRERSREKRARSRSPTKSGYGLIIPKGKVEKSSRSSEKYESAFAKYKTETAGYTRKEKHGFANKMSAEEKAKRLAEMSSNAVWRDENRQTRVKNDRAMDAKEEKEFKANDHSFFRQMKMAATDKSLEERVKARTASNQKTVSALEKNWIKR